MEKVVIEFENVSKEFISWMNRPNSIKKILSDVLTGKFEAGHKQKVQVLKNISFKIRAGEFVGIMGRNGAGKSTLLKLMTGIYKPTSGRIQVDGRIAPLLELGAGFAPELSGYENIFLNAAILGFSRAQTLQCVDKIVEFSELNEHIHMPVRNYSSGMLVRLGFSIAAFLDAPILLFDEILAVGDMGFQNKCLNKINSLYHEGRSIILVTHSPALVEQFCQRCILIDKNQVLFDGPAKEGTEQYLKVFA